MSDSVVRVQGLGKRYVIGASQPGYGTLRDSIVEAVRRRLFRERHAGRGEAGGHADGVPSFWALKDVTFDVRQGEVVGVVGRNGAGKSTLLKLLSRITTPTEGSIELCGRVGSLLEVGTGFHPELTGRENVFLNGAILGMRRREIARKFDDIVAFAEVERFIDTPVKRYSSGMHLRLAFAVAAYLDPEILIVDEVLAVGDARFQKRCLDKMRDVSRDGRTVLFVSHDMAAVSRLCERAILMDGGHVSLDGPTQQVVRTYLSAGRSSTGVREWNAANAPAGEVARLRAMRIRTADGRLAESIDIRQGIGLEMELDVLRPGSVVMPFINVFNDASVHVLELVDLDPEWRRRPRPAGRYVVTAWIPGNLLAEGQFFVSPGATTLDPPVLQFNEPEAVSFQLFDSLDGDSARGDWAGRMTSVVRPLLRWTTRVSYAAEAVDSEAPVVSSLRR